MLHRCLYASTWNDARCHRCQLYKWYDNDLKKTSFILYDYKCLDFFSSLHNVGQKKKLSFSFLMCSLLGLVGQFNRALTLHTLLTCSLFFLLSLFCSNGHTQFEVEKKSESMNISQHHFKMKQTFFFLCLRLFRWFLSLCIYVCIHWFPSFYVCHCLTKMKSRVNVG